MGKCLQESLWTLPQHFAIEITECFGKSTITAVTSVE
jgi:hypothetical protein